MAAFILDLIMRGRRLGMCYTFNTLL